MKTIAFKYTKKDQSTSNRVLLVMVEPKPAVDKYAGIDLSELDDDSQAEFAGRANEVHQRYIDDLKDLQSEFDVSDRYRQFFANQTSELQVLR